MELACIEAVGVPLGKRFVNAWCVVGVIEHAYLDVTRRSGCHLEEADLSVVLCIALTFVAGMVFSLMSLILLATELNADEE